LIVYFNLGLKSLKISLVLFSFSIKTHARKTLFFSINLSNRAYVPICLTLLLYYEGVAIIMEIREKGLVGGLLQLGY